MLDHILVLVRYVHCPLLLLLNALTNYLDSGRVVAILWCVYSVKAINHDPHQNTNLNSLRYYLGWRDILPAERRPCCRATDNKRHCGRNRQEGLSSIGPIFRDIIY